MANIENVVVPYSSERSNIRTISGTSVASGPSEHAAFEHFNIWIPGETFNDSGQNSPSTFLANSTAMGDKSGRYITRKNKAGNFHATTNLLCRVRRPRMWSDGLITGRFHYTGIGDSGTTIVTRFTTIIRRGAVNSSAATTGIIEIPCPTSDGEWMTHRLDEDENFQALVSSSSDTVYPDGIDLFIEFIIGSSGAASQYEENVLFLGFELMYKPADAVGINTAIPSWSNRP